MSLITKITRGLDALSLVFALFDWSVSHSFISADLVKTIERVKCPTRKPLLVQTPMGEIQADQVCSNINLVIKKENFTVNLIVLESLNIPLVLGNGWLCAHKAVIYATQWKIFLTAPSGKRIEYQGGPLLPEEAYPCRGIMFSSCINWKVGSQDGQWAITNNRHLMEVLFASCDPQT